MAPARKPAPPLSWHWRYHTSNSFGPVRVWRSDWSPDQFEIVLPNAFADFQALAVLLGIPLSQAEDD